jgi:ABC-type nitrate/sulfonate/bicarbonate transport system substrate-binding protein
MARFIIEPHFRLHEWVAEEKGFFRAEGLDYEFKEMVQATDGAIHDTADKQGAYQAIEQGRESTVSCACHWTVNVAASTGHTKIFADAYSVSPSGIFVAADSGLRRPEDLAGVPISVGYQSGSHYSTIQVLEQYMAPDDINLSFKDGLLFNRMELLIEGKVPAAALFSGPYYFAEQLGFRKVADSTFMMSASIKPGTNVDDVRKYYRALKKAQMEIDLRPELYTHYYKKEFPVRFHDRMDTRRWGPGERIVFEPYTRESFERSFRWIAERGIFPPDGMGEGNYDKAIFALT